MHGHGSIVVGVLVVARGRPLAELVFGAATGVCCDRLVLGEGGVVYIYRWRSCSGHMDFVWKNEED